MCFECSRDEGKPVDRRGFVTAAAAVASAGLALGQPPAPVADAREFERTLQAQGTPVELFTYEGAGHGFYGNTWKEQTPEFGYNAEATATAHGRMMDFLARQLK